MSLRSCAWAGCGANKDGMDASHPGKRVGGGASHLRHQSAKVEALVQPLTMEAPYEYYDVWC
jgi:hypothetical protein